MIIQLSVCFISVLFGLRAIRHKPYFKLELLYILPFCMIDLLTSSIAVYGLTTNNYTNNLYYWGIVFTIAEYFLLPAYIAKVIDKGYKIFFPLIVFLLATILSKASANSFSLLPEAISGIYISYWGFKYLNRLLSSEKTTRITHHPNFWIILGMMSCYTTTIPLSIFSFVTDGLMGEELKKVANQILLIFLFANTIMHLFFIKAFLCTPGDETIEVNIQYLR